MVLFETKDLSFTYPKCDTPALCNVNLTVNSGDFAVLAGRTGAGKSTLLRLLNKKLAPFGSIDGDIIINAKMSGFVSQNPDTSFVAETVRGELAFALENMRMSSDSITVRIGETASFFDLSDMLDRKLADLSGGERAVTTIAAAMISGVDAIILDEPLAQLDPKASAQVISLLKRVNEELGVTVILSSHTLHGLIDCCDKVALMQNGKIAACGSPRDMAQQQSALEFFPIYTKMFSQRPLTVKQAIPLAKSLKEKTHDPMRKSDASVILKSVTFAYGKKEKDILSVLSYRAYKGCIHAVIGANGSGKTTLLKVIAGIKKPYSGRVKIDGKTAYLPQDPRYLFTRDTVGEEIDESTAEKFGLLPFLLRHPYDLSGGQTQKLALAILSQTDFDVLLLDEPSKALDAPSKRELTEYLRSVADLGKTVIIVSHDLDFVGDTADYVSFLCDGIISVAGDRRSVLSSLNYYTTTVRRFTARYLKSAVSSEDLI